jgi:hypothetical protein
MNPFLEPKKKTRVRARAEGRAPARQKEGVEPYDFVCHGTRQWRALVALDPDRMAVSPIRHGVGDHANHTGFWFPRSLIQKALHEVAAARDPPPSPAAANGAQPGEDDDEQFTAGLRRI